MPHEDFFFCSIYPPTQLLNYREPYAVTDGPYSIAREILFSAAIRRIFKTA